jgi:hypothetical protein
MLHARALRSAPLSLLSFAFFSLAVLGTTGCGANQASSPSLTDTSTARTLEGNVYGGQQPVVGATIQLYAAGTTGLGQGAESLIAAPLPTTNANGAFTFTYNLPSTPSYFYIVATGGSPGSGNTVNPNIVLIAALGGCTASTTIPSSFININEVTTAAAVLELQPYTAAPTGAAGASVLIGAPAAQYNDLRTAFENASNLVSASTGTVVNSTGSKGPLINTLADILASCVNSDPDNSSNCSNLFTDATPSDDTKAGDTAQAAWYIAQNPTTNTSTLFNLISGTNPPFVALSSAPASFAVSRSTDSLACFAVLGSTTVTNTGTTVVSGGDLGLSPGTSVDGGITMTSPAVEYTGTSPVAANAQTDLTAAYTYAAGLTPTGSLLADMTGLTFTPGVYDGGAVALSAGSVTLNAQGDPDAVFIFQIGSTLIPAADTQVVLENGAQAQNVFWQVGSSATLGANSIFYGTIMAKTTITLGNDVTLYGRALASTGAVNLAGDTITAP